MEQWKRRRRSERRITDYTTFTNRRQT
jgi:hypothetical protein